MSKEIHIYSVVHIEGEGSKGQLSGCGICTLFKTESDEQCRYIGYALGASVRNRSNIVSAITALKCVYPSYRKLVTKLYVETIAIEDLKKEFNDYKSILYKIAKNKFINMSYDIIDVSESDTHIISTIRSIACKCAMEQKHYDSEEQ